MEFGNPIEFSSDLVRAALWEWRDAIGTAWLDTITRDPALNQRDIRSDEVPERKLDHAGRMAVGSFAGGRRAPPSNWMSSVCGPWAKSAREMISYSIEPQSGTALFVAAVAPELTE